MSGRNAARALIRSSVELKRFLEGCTPLAPHQLFSDKDLIPIDLRETSPESESASQLVDNLIGRVRANPQEYAAIVEIVGSMEGSSLVVEELKKNYGMINTRKSARPLHQ